MGWKDNRGKSFSERSERFLLRLQSDIWESFKKKPFEMVGIGRKF